MDHPTSLEGILGQYEGLLRKNLDQKTQVIEIVQKLIGVNILPMDISIVGERVIFRVHATIRTELFLHKQEILEEFRRSSQSEMRIDFGSFET